MTTDDPIVEEVRATRKKIESALGNEFKTLYQQMLELQKQYSSRLVTIPLPPPVSLLAPQNSRE